MVLLRNLGSALSSLLYWPICRAYARHFVGDKPADPIMRVLCALYFMKAHGYRPHFKNPRSFMEKTWRRMLFDRDPLLTLCSDKLRVRAYVASKAGPEYLVPLFWAGEKPEEIPFDELPAKCVIKTNHGCGYNIFVKDKTHLDRSEVRRQLGTWLRENFCQDAFLGVAWAYKNITPAIIVESLLEDNGRMPADYKFFCYSGRAEFLKIDFDRFEDHSEAFFDRALKPLDLFGKGIKQQGGQITLPDNFPEMVRVAEAVARGIDFIRVDLYSVAGRIYVGELTCYHGGGLIRLYPRRYDFLFGEKWKVGHPLVDQDEHAPNRQAPNVMSSGGL